MMPLPLPLQALYDQLLSGAAANRQTALDQLLQVLDADKDAVSQELIHFLAERPVLENRSWAVRALGELNRDAAVAALQGMTTPANEPREWCRYAAAAALAWFPPARSNLAAQFPILDADPSVWIKALSCRLLFGKGGGAPTNLKNTLQSGLSGDRLAACWVLRSEPGVPPLKESEEPEFSRLLAEILRNQRELDEVRYQAARALGELKYDWATALQALDEVRQSAAPAVVRHGCVEALLELNRPETRAAFLSALRDADAEIRVRSTKGLQGLLGSQGAVAAVVEQTLSQNQPDPRDLEAIRQLDRKAAVSLLAVKLTDADDAIRARAARALAAVGADMLFRALQRPQPAVDKNQKQMVDTLNSLGKSAQTAACVGMVLHGVLFALAVVGLIYGAWIAINGSKEFERYVAIGLGALSLGTLLVLVYCSPLRGMRRALASLVKAQVAFLCSIHQINQTEVLAHPLYLASAATNPEQLKEAVRQVQASLREVLDQVDGLLGAG
jgi:hypothetical protein